MRAPKELVTQSHSVSKSVSRFYPVGHQPAMHTERIFELNSKEVVHRAQTTVVWGGGRQAGATLNVTGPLQVV